MSPQQLQSAKSGVPNSTESASREKSAERLRWLDLTRLIAAIMVVSIHWLRAAYRVGSFSVSSNDQVSIVMNTQEHIGGLAIFHYMLIDGTRASLDVWLTNLIGLFGEFGWEAVSAIIITSGFSLYISQQNRPLTFVQWVAWLLKRARRILIPYYLVALPFLALCGTALFVLPSIHAKWAGVINNKLISQFHTPPLGVLLSHLIFVDPYASQWAPDFIAPAWWFVPAILLAYAAYPALRLISRQGNGIPLLFLTALISVLSFWLKERGILVNETWYYIVLQESFNFALGIVLARAWVGPHRHKLEGALRDLRLLAAALIIFTVGNVANWTPAIRPIAALLYGPALFLIIAHLSMRVEHRFGRAAALLDPYDLYLIHQPFAFPIALASIALFRGYATIAGWLIFVVLVCSSTMLFSKAQLRLWGNPSAVTNVLVPRRSQ